VINFNLDNKQKSTIALQLMKRIMEILKVEGIGFDKKVIAELIKKYFPDMRKTFNELQTYGACGKIDSGILTQIQADINIQELSGFLKDKDFRGMRKWVVQNVDSDPTSIFRKIYITLTDFLKAHSVPQAVLVLADYQYKAAFVADAELNLVACLTEIMAECDFK